MLTQARAAPAFVKHTVYRLYYFFFSTMSATGCKPRFKSPSGNASIASSSLKNANARLKSPGEHAKGASQCAGTTRSKSHLELTAATQRRTALGFCA